MNSDLGPIHIVQPGQGQSHWQPVPANGFIDILMAPDMVAMETKFGFGRQTVAPGGHVRTLARNSPSDRPAHTPACRAHISSTSNNGS